MVSESRLTWLARVETATSSRVFTSALSVLKAVLNVSNSTSNALNVVCDTRELTFASRLVRMKSSSLASSHSASTALSPSSVSAAPAARPQAVAATICAGDVRMSSGIASCTASRPSATPAAM